MWKYLKDLSADEPEFSDKISELVVVSGVSGSGKSTALNALEDLGYFCIDNLPAELVSSFVDYLLTSKENTEVDKSILSGDTSSQQEQRFALLLNCREQRWMNLIDEAFSKLRSSDYAVILLFLDCNDQTVLRRFRETRRPHPFLVGDQDRTTVRQALNKEREQLSSLRSAANKIFDTSQFTPHDLRRAIEHFVGGDRNLLEIELVSFGFKYGPPQDADLVVDVRFLPNPHFVPELRVSTGENEEVRNYVFSNGDAEKFATAYLELLHFLIPRYAQEGKQYLTIAIGCTGGKHRSVALAIEMEKRLKNLKHLIRIRHRDRGRSD